MKCRDRKTHVSWRHYHPEMFCTFRMIWKLSGWSGNFPDGLETFRMIWKWSGNVLYFPDDLKTFWMIWKLSGWFGNFPDDKFFQKCIYVNVAKTIDPLFWCICRENNLRAPSRKFLRVKICHPESLDFLGLWRNEAIRKGYLLYLMLGANFNWCWISTVRCDAYNIHSLISLGAYKITTKRC